MLQWLFDLFKKKIEFFVKKDESDIEKLLIEKFKQEKREGVISLIKPVQIFNLDKEMYLCTKEDMMAYLRSNLLSLKFSKLEVNDCDDFALHLWSQVKKDYPLLSFGFVLSSGHAFNIFIDNNLEIWIVEPQTDELISLDKAKKKDLYKNFKLIIM